MALGNVEEMMEGFLCSLMFVDKMLVLYMLNFGIKADWLTFCYKNLFSNICLRINFYAGYALKSK